MCITVETVLRETRQYINMYSQSDMHDFLHIPSQLDTLKLEQNKI